MRLLALGSAVAAAVGMLLAPAAQAAPMPSSSGSTVSAARLLSHLTVQAPDRSHRYDRRAFGYDAPGLDADGDGCSTRKEVLIRDAVRLGRVSASCAVTGRWRSLYDGRVTTDPARLEVDHLVPLAEAWHAGAWRWSAAKRVAFGNDVDYVWDLQAVTASLNQDKRDQDPARWMPKRDRCTYAKAWIGVKTRWKLSVDRAERAALVRGLANCGPDRAVLRPGVPDVARLARATTPVVTTPVPAPSASAAPAPSSTAAPEPVNAAPVTPTVAPVPVAPVVPAPTASVDPMSIPVTTAIPVTIPVAVPVPMSAPIATPAPTETVSATPVAPPAPTASAPSAYYANCTAVRAAGKAPLHAGEPGYSRSLDRDGDGIACE